jgi:hypothetical protein
LKIFFDNQGGTISIGNEVPDMSIPLEIHDQLEKAINSIEANKIGIEIVQEMLLQIINQKSSAK